jgi:hypothetical protein
MQSMPFFGSEERSAIDSLSFHQEHYGIFDVFTTLDNSLILVGSDPSMRFVAMAVFAADTALVNVSGSAEPHLPSAALALSESCTWSSDGSGQISGRISLVLPSLSVSMPCHAYLNAEMQDEKIVLRTRSPSRHGGIEELLIREDDIKRLQDTPELVDKVSSRKGSISAREAFGAFADDVTVDSIAAKIQSDNTPPRTPGSPDSALLAMGTEPLPPLTLRGFHVIYENVNLSIRFSLAGPCSAVKECTFSAHPTLVYYPTGSDSAFAATVVVASPIPTTWAFPSAADGAAKSGSRHLTALEVHRRNVFFHFMRSEDGSCPDTSEIDIDGRRFVTFEETQASIKCKSFVFATEQSGGKLFVVRWEAPESEWGASLPSLHTFIDTLRVLIEA